MGAKNREGEGKGGREVESAVYLEPFTSLKIIVEPQQ